MSVERPSDAQLASEYLSQVQQDMLQTFGQGPNFTVKVDKETIELFEQRLQFAASLFDRLGEEDSVGGDELSLQRKEFKEQAGEMRSLAERLGALYAESLGIELEPEERLDTEANLERFSAMLDAEGYQFEGEDYDPEANIGFADGEIAISAEELNAISQSFSTSITRFSSFLDGVEQEISQRQEGQNFKTQNQQSSNPKQYPIQKQLLHLCTTCRQCKNSPENKTILSDKLQLFIQELNDQLDDISDEKSSGLHLAWKRLEQSIDEDLERLGDKELHYELLNDATIEAHEEFLQLIEELSS